LKAAWLRRPVLLEEANRSLFPQIVFTEANEDSEDFKPFLPFVSFWCASTANQTNELKSVHHAN
jgi:hypothetical protein